MAEAGQPPDAFALSHPHIAAWVSREEGWIEVGQDEFSSSFVRAVYGGGLAWEGAVSYPSMDEALRALDAGIAAWLAENRPESLPRPARRVRKRRE